MKTTQGIAKGIWPTMLTPYTEQGRIDLDAVTQMVDWYAKTGCNGIFAVCQSSEMFYLSVEERLTLVRTVVEAAAGRLEVIASGHVSDERNAQLKELEAMASAGVKAVVMVSNRLAAQDEADEVWIARAREIVDALPEVTFGLYECPFPYKRLLSKPVLRWCAESGRFAFLKDTCCDAQLIRQRIRWIQDAADRAGVSPLRLFNANSMTLLESLRDGAAGFSGVMANFHPELYVWLYQHFQDEPHRAERLQSMLTLLSALEGCAYPICAKQHMIDSGVSMSLRCRSRAMGEFGYREREILRQAEIMEKMIYEMYGIAPRPKEW